MLYKEYKPHESLEEHIKCFWVLEKEYNSSNQCELVYPDSYFELIFSYSASYKLLNPHGMQPLSSVFLIGLLQKPLSLYCDGVARILCVRFYPWGAHTFLPHYVKASNDSARSIDFPHNRMIQKLSNSVEASDYDTAIRNLQQGLLEFSLETIYDRQLVRNASEYLFQKKGQCRIEEVAELCHRSLRQVQRRFNDEYGVTMKSMAQNFRFDEIKKHLTKNPDSDLTEVAYEYGFFDQAHFIKEFKRFSGKTPTDFCKEIKAIQEHWGQNVVFLQ
jgi:AraC-like DNA-binding protein